MRMTTAPTCHRPRPVVQKMLLALLPLLVLPGCATENEAGTVVGSAAVGAAIGALGGAALGSTYHHGYYYGYPSRSDMAASGALAGAAVGGVIGMANVAQQRENQRREDYYRAQEAARQYGNTQCTTVRTVDDYGHVRTTETCTSDVQRPGYQSY